VAGEDPQSVAGDGSSADSAAGSEQPLICPGCAREHPPSERFCQACGMPLVQMTGAVEAVLSERQQRARKIKPQYSEGKLVKVAAAQNGVEAEMIQGLLLEEGIPSMAQRAPGADVPDFLIAGRRDILVPESGAQAAREALAWET
jgi:pimeloyl-ACP methyl ester carboxylesterase